MNTAKIFRLTTVGIGNKVLQCCKPRVISSLKVQFDCRKHSIITYTQVHCNTFSSSFFYKSLTELDSMTENRFACDYAKMGTSSCKKCKTKMAKGEFRIAKVMTNYFNDGGGDMKQYHHPACIFETFVRARATTKIIETPDDLDGFGELVQDDKDLVNKLIKETMDKKGTPKKKTPSKPKASPALKKTPSKTSPAASQSASASSPLLKAKAEPKATTSAPFSTAASKSLSQAGTSEGEQKDNAFRNFRRLCAEISEESSYGGKTKIVQSYIRQGSSGDGYHGDLYLLIKMLLPGVDKTVYNINSKQLVKVFSQVFGESLEDMVEDLNQGDVAETIRVFFEKSQKVSPQKKSTLSIQEVDAFLEELSEFTKEDDQQKVLTKIAKRSTGNDLKMIVRLVKHDLRINSGAKHVLDALDPNAYDAFKASRDLEDVIKRISALKNGESKPGMKKLLSIKANLMTPVQPMLAEACKSVDAAFKRSPNGMYAEIKYDGERVQLHKQGGDFQYFSRSLKPVVPHKVQHFKEFIPKAFPTANELILDCEVLLIDTNTHKPLPFGTLGVHKKAAFQDANVCLFVFDCIHLNGENLMDKPIKTRRKILHENMTEIENRVLFSEMKHLTKPRELNELMMSVFREGLEGLVLKDLMSIYEPGKRHWLKVKKDYIAQGAMADSADLVVLGAYYGTGSKGGIMSSFLMGVHDPAADRWCTVTKCHGGFDDKALEKLQKEINAVKISKDFSKVPKWLNMNRTLVPDFVVRDPKAAPVWEITGAEFTKSDVHTADGISIRFPRCTKIRDDKSWREATNLSRLKVLFTKSKEFSDIPDAFGGSKSKKDDSPPPDKSPKKKVESNNSISGFFKKGDPGKRPSSSAAENASPAKKSKSSLPDVFSGMKFHIPESIQNRDDLCRYIIAFDGEVVSEFDKDAATHAVSDKAKVTGKTGGVTCVSAEWVWKCIRRKKIVKSKKS